MFSKVLLINKKVMVCKGMNQTGTQQAQQQGGQVQGQPQSTNQTQAQQQGGQGQGQPQQK